MSLMSPDAAIVLIRRHDEACTRLANKETKHGYAALKKSCVHLFVAIVGRRPTTEEISVMIG